VDITGDSDGNGQWMTYAEIADARGIKRIAAVRLTQRHGWRRQKGNDGFARVLVPPDMLRPERAHAGNIAGDVTGDSRVPSLLAQTVAALETALTEANGRADSALALADRTLTQLADADARADKLRTLLTEAEAQRDTARGEATAAKEAAEAERDRIAGELAQAVERRTATEVEARVLREAENARQQLGRWRRAWRGWRGR
jgi:hypothetical protein